MNKMTNEQKQLVLDNYNLVHFVMHKKFPAYYPGSYEYEDLSQQGYLGLCLAAMQYNPDLSSFSTYAFNYIWGYIARYRNQKSEWAFHIRRDGKWEYFERNRFYRFKRIENMSKETREEKIKEEKVDMDWLINRFLKEN